MGPEIEFVDEPAPEGQLDPARPPRRPLPRGVIVTGVLAVVVAVVVWALVQPSGAPAQQAAVRPSPSPSSSPAEWIPFPSPAPAPACAATVCRTVPADVRSALDDYLSGPTETTVTTRTTVGPTDGPQLVSRLIRTHVGRAELLIRMRPYRHNVPPPVAGIVTTPEGLVSFVFQISNVSFVVDVQWLAPPGVQPPGTLTDLAGDDRLGSLD